MKKDSFDQTQFGQSGALYEQPQVEPVIEPVEPELSPTPPQPSRKKTYILIALAVLMILLAVVVLLARRPSNPTQQPATSAQPQQEIPDTPLGKRVKELQAEIELADPSQDDLPFPPVDLAIDLAN